MKKRLMTGMMACVLALGVTAMGKTEPKDSRKSVVQLAILLDTSGSMDGLIEQAKSQLWRIVNQFTSATGPDGQRPDVEVALYQYGTPSLGAETGYIRQLLPLTADLDKVSEALFALKTNGGDEYCGRVIQTAVAQLRWSSNKGDYKAIFIAGNEPFTQGSVDFHSSCKAAISNGIVVNTIFCGGNTEGINTQWKDGADLADGSYFSIDQNQKIVSITTPFDKELVELGGKLNNTYVAYGVGGKEGQARQAAQDANAASVPGAVAASRAVAKASLLYRNSTWDLVDAVNEKQVSLEEMKPEELPDEMKKLSASERQAYVETKTKERTEMQKQIAKLNRERDAYVAAEQKKAVSASATNTLDSAIITAVRAQATRASFQFKD